MTRRRPARLAVAILERFVPRDEPLTGDLVEESANHSDIWLWRQVLYVVLTRTIRAGRLSGPIPIGAALVGMAIVALLGFQAVVAARLVTSLFGLQETAWMSWARGQRDWLAGATLPLFVVAVLLGRSLGRFHATNRIATILVGGASATAAALSVDPFMPSLAVHTALATVFVVGLFAGARSMSPCEPTPAS